MTGVGNHIFLFTLVSLQIASTQNNFDVSISQRLYTTFKPAQCVKNMYNVEHFDTISLSTKLKPTPPAVVSTVVTKDSTSPPLSTPVDFESGFHKTAVSTPPVINSIMQKCHSAHTKHYCSLSMCAFGVLGLTAVLMPLLAPKHMTCTPVLTSIFAIGRSCLYFKLNAKIMRGCLNCAAESDYPLYKYSKSFWKQHAAYDILPLIAVEIVQLIATALCS